MATRGMMVRVGGNSGTVDAAEAASLLGWWLEAGVDTLVAETPRAWLRTASPVQAASDEELAPAATSLAISPASVDRQALSSLEEFHGWLREGSDLPLFQAGAARALPHGPANAGIMLIADLPDRECAAEGRPIGGASWELTTRMLAAIGFKPEDAYVASLACFPAPAKRLDPRIAAQCVDDMKRHIALVAPKRLLLLGEGPARALTGQNLLQARGRIHRIDHVPAVVTFHPRQLLQRPSDKAYAWRDLLLLMSEEVS
ncbi:uracil-DNA glycosylase [Sphingomonas sp. BN140010]|uniref:Uracil-DNA glycosylase n=1 Tax=Sphingomonas arvum TaxID=2992113 RepID=A0ABT3JED4_9SPHN|nr:uracil-DNA glycosylase [Sphingomonas sp. BN140010]MCW3797436.1 uracil-DNA glycosylase [Sphingomonas sp. BN140010]